MPRTLCRYSHRAVVFKIYPFSYLKNFISNLDVSIGDTERWVGCLQRQCNQNILSAAKPAQRSVSQILTSEFDIDTPVKFSTILYANFILPYFIYTPVKLAPFCTQT